MAPALIFAGAMRWFLVPSILLSACVAQNDPGSGSGSAGSGGTCGVDPTTSSPEADFDTYGVAFTHEPIGLTTGWTDACSSTACVYLGYGSCTTPTIDANVTATGVDNQIQLLGATGSDPGREDGAYRKFAIVPSVAGDLTVHVVTTRPDSAFVWDERFTVLDLEDIELHCLLGTDPTTAQPCGATIASGAPFMVSFDGVAGGEHYAIAARLAWVGADPTDCDSDLCELGGGATDPVTVTADYGGVTRKLTIAIAAP